MHDRFRKRPGPFTDVEFATDKIDAPVHRKKPTVYVAWNDPFHEECFTGRLLDVALQAKQHRFLLLTKRPRRMASLMKRWAKGCGILPNVGLGVSVEDQATADERIPLLLDTPAAFRFVNYGPALGPVNFAQRDGPSRPRGASVPACMKSPPQAAGLPAEGRKRAAVKKVAKKKAKRNKS